MLYRELHLSNYASFEVSAPKMKRAFDRLARDRHNHILVAEAGGRILGTAHLIIFDHLGHGLAPMAVVENVVVASDARSMGVGQRLMEAVGDIARHARCYKIALTSNVSRTGAHRFYERLGWKRTHYGYSIGVN